MRFACLHHGDPVSESLWSGIPLNIVRTLRELGHEVVAIGPLNPEAPFVSRVKTQIYRHIFKKMYLINRDPAVVKKRAPEANRLLANAGRVDAVLITYPPDAVQIDRSYPVVIIHDATWTQLLDFYPGLEREALAAETISGGIELDQMGLDRCDHVIYSSDWAAGGAISDFGVPQKKVSVASLGANMKNAPTAADVTSFSLKRGQGPMKLLFVGKEWHRKGGDIAVSVASEIENLGVPVELHVVGCDPEGHVPSFVRPYGWLRKDVPQEADELRELYESSDFFIMPTRADCTPVVFAESAAYGLPTIATDVGGVKDVIRGEWGIALPLGASPVLYAEWAVKHFKNRVEYERLSGLARESYEDHLNWPAFCHHLVKVVADLSPVSNGTRS